MHRVRLDALGEVLSDRAGVCLGGVGGAHDLAVFHDGALALQDLDDDGARGHEVDEGAVEGAFFMDGVERLGLGLREVQALLRDDAQARLLEALVDGARQVTAGGVGLDNREGALGGHEGVSRGMKRAAPGRLSKGRGPYSGGRRGSASPHAPARRQRPAGSCCQ